MKDVGRTPQGVRGLKHFQGIANILGDKSHSARSAWIETLLATSNEAVSTSHSARSAWIETARTVLLDLTVSSRTPQGVRGLKPRRF